MSSKIHNLYTVIQWLREVAPPMENQVMTAT